MFRTAKLALKRVLIRLLIRFYRPVHKRMGAPLAPLSEIKIPSRPEKKSFSFLFYRSNSENNSLPFVTERALAWVHSSFASLEFRKIKCRSNTPRNLFCGDRVINLITIGITIVLFDCVVSSLPAIPSQSKPRLNHAYYCNLLTIAMVAYGKNNITKARLELEREGEIYLIIS